MPQTRFAFDVGTVLGIGTPDPSSLPEAADGEILLRVTDGLSLLTLRDSEIGQDRMYQQDWYGKCGWSREEIPLGIYRLRVPVPGSYGKTYHEQKTLLAEGEAVAPVAAVAAALLCMQRTGQPDPLQNKWARCAESTSAGKCVELCWHVGRLYVFAYWGAARGSNVGVSSLRIA